MERLISVTGRSISIDAEWDLSGASTTRAYFVDGVGNRHLIIAGPPTWHETLTGHFDNRPDLRILERKSAPAGRGRTIRTELVERTDELPGGRRETGHFVCAAIETAAGTLISSVNTNQANQASEYLQSFEIRDSSEGVWVENAIDVSMRPPTLLKAFVGAGLVRSNPLTRATAKRLPPTSGRKVPGGELHDLPTGRDQLDGRQEKTIIFDSQQISTLSAMQPSDRPQELGESLVVEWE